MNPNIKKDKWSPEEDAKLTDLVEQYGNRWADIARQLEGRTDQQCMGRWTRHLDPNISRETWTADEDVRLVQLYQTHGTQWSRISKHIEGRTAQQCRARFFQVKGQPAPGMGYGFSPDGISPAEALDPPPVPSSQPRKTKGGRRRSSVAAEDEYDAEFEMFGNYKPRSSRRAIKTRVRDEPDTPSPSTRHAGGKRGRPSLDTSHVTARRGRASGHKKGSRSSHAHTSVPTSSSYPHPGDMGPYPEADTPGGGPLGLDAFYGAAHDLGLAKVSPPPVSGGFVGHRTPGGATSLLPPLPPPPLRAGVPLRDLHPNQVVSGARKAQLDTKAALAGKLNPPHVSVALAAALAAGLSDHATDLTGLTGLEHGDQDGAHGRGGGEGGRGGGRTGGGGGGGNGSGRGRDGDADRGHHDDEEDDGFHLHTRRHGGAGPSGRRHHATTGAGTAAAAATTTTTQAASPTTHPSHHHHRHPPLGFGGASTWATPSKTNPSSQHPKGVSAPGSAVPPLFTPSAPHGSSFHLTYTPGKLLHAPGTEPLSAGVGVGNLFGVGPASAGNTPGSAIMRGDRSGVTTRSNRTHHPHHHPTAHHPPPRRSTNPPSAAAPPRPQSAHLWRLSPTANHALGLLSPGTEGLLGGLPGDLLGPGSLHGLMGYAVAGSTPLTGAGGLTPGQPATGGGISPLVGVQMETPDFATGGAARLFHLTSHGIGVGSGPGTAGFGPRGAGGHSAGGSRAVGRRARSGMETEEEDADEAEEAMGRTRNGMGTGRGTGTRKSRRLVGPGRDDVDGDDDLPLTGSRLDARLAAAAMEEQVEEAAEAAMVEVEAVPTQAPTATAGASILPPVPSNPEDADRGEYDVAGRGRGRRASLRTPVRVGVGVRRVEEAGGAAVEPSLVGRPDADPGEVDVHDAVPHTGQTELLPPATGTGGRGRGRVSLASVQKGPGRVTTKTRMQLSQESFSPFGVGIGPSSLVKARGDRRATQPNAMTPPGAHVPDGKDSKLPKAKLIHQLEQC